MERMAAGQPARGEPASFEGAVPRQGLQRVLGARRMESAARRKERRENGLVPADQGGEKGGGGDRLGPAGQARGAGGADRRGGKAGIPRPPARAAASRAAAGAAGK